MDAEVLLLNPRPRARKSGSKRQKNPSPAQRSARAKFAAMARGRARAARASNPSPRRSARRRNPVAPVIAYRRRASARRRNPINVGGIIGTIKAGAIQAGGAIAMDVLYSQIARFLPGNMQAGAGQLNAGSLLKLAITAALGKALKGPTRGMSEAAAVGAITVQARDMILGALPPGLIPGMSTGGAVAGRMGYAVPAPVSNYSPRVGPNRSGPLGLYTSGATPLLSQYTSGASPLLSGGVRTRSLRRVR